MHNKPDIYTINDAPPSYAEATGALASDTQNPQLGQRYPHTTTYPSPSAPFPHPYSPNYGYQNMDRVPIQSSYPQYESTEHQSQPTDVTYNRTVITRTNSSDYKPCTRLFRMIWVLGILASIGALITLILRAFQ
ncbi:hypothetical protein ALC62_05128 [Cyphomyrmex costatus]|uniref:Uncharacterized protein n=1 Tax=Cyphomyrmex costatus TaxID=456900 RepID=A0A195CV12_9HYME|nr:hypothetical protein ALC62_05128 [Cyphomyrmex costatus]